MFEESLFNSPTAPAAAPTQAGDFLHGYEIKSWTPSPRLYKILAASAAANVLAILVVAQTSLLTMKGCDSPFVGRVCEVLDTVYVGSMLFGTDREYVDAAYDKIDLGDSEITYIDVSGATPPISYPEGYFQIANPVQYAMLQQQAANPVSGFDTSGFPGTRSQPSASDGGLANVTPKTPPPNSNPVQGELPGSISSNGPNPTVRRPQRGRRGGPPKGIPGDANDQSADKGDVNAEPDPTPLSTDAVAAVEINKKPLTDFADEVVAKWANNEVDLNQEFTVVLDAVLTKDGKLDPKKSKWDPNKQKGDPKMIEIAREAMEAVGSSGFLTYLRSLDVEKLTVTLVQDGEKITALLSSAQKSPERARTISSGMNGYLMIGKTITKNPSDERTLLDGAKVTSEGTNFILNFEIPKAIAQEMINRKLKEAQAKKAQQQQPNGTAVAKPNENTARK